MDRGPSARPLVYVASTAWQPSGRHALGIATASQQALARASRRGWVKRGWDEHADVPFFVCLSILDGFVLLCPVAHVREAEHNRHKRSRGVAARPLVVLLPFPLRCCSTSWPQMLRPCFYVSRPWRLSPEQNRSRGRWTWRRREPPPAPSLIRPTLKTQP
jgi:hypothetical protein